MINHRQQLHTLLRKTWYSYIHTNTNNNINININWRRTDNWGRPAEATPATRARYAIVSFMVLNSKVGLLLLDRLVFFFDEGSLRICELENCEVWKRRRPGKVIDLVELTIVKSARGLTPLTAALFQQKTKRKRETKKKILPFGAVYTNTAWDERRWEAISHQLLSTTNC